METTITTGSEKQIAWATKIRAALVLQRELAEETATPGMMDRVSAMTASVEWNNTTARYWIDSWKDRVPAQNWNREDWLTNPGYQGSMLAQQYATL